MLVFPKRYDVIVVGAGHAGVEASLAAARMGCEALLLTANPDTIAQMSCNPAIGGSGKGQIVREIDALGGEMGLAADMAGVQFRVLNMKRGPAVHSRRAQCDKKAYQFRMKRICEVQERLNVKQGSIERIVSNDGTCVGVETADGVRYLSVAVVVTTGTFLQALLYFGLGRTAGGRAADHTSVGLSASLKEHGLEIGRLKTGTPPRLSRGQIDFSGMESQPGDYPVPYFGHRIHDLFHVEHHGGNVVSLLCSSELPKKQSVLEQAGGQMMCHLTYTTKRTAGIVLSNLSKSPLYSGAIKGAGPRYCPSIEDKIVRFTDKDRHQIFLEPEGISTEEIYVNGLSTSLPCELQLDLVRSIIGCEDAQVVRPAYAVEYDYVFPTQLRPTLETKVCKNLFLAGQINGTSGYEEAAGQGIMAGINAALTALGRKPLVLRRDQAYIGVLIDDLVTKGTNEPYRMFPSRCEHRLLLREDNADLRLSDLGHEMGLLPKASYDAFLVKQREVTEELRRLNSVRVGANTLAQLLRRPDVTYKSLPHQNPTVSEEVAQQVEIAIKYEGYIRRQEQEAGRAGAMEDKRIPAAFDFSAVPNLRTEARQKLSQIRPATLGQASRISGVSPADISSLTVWLRRASQTEPPALSPFSVSHESRQDDDDEE